MAFATNDVIAIVYVETLGGLLRKNIFGRLYDNWQSIDDDTFSNQRVTNDMKSSNALVIVAISGNINDLPAARELLVEPRVAEQKRFADKRINADLRTLCLSQSISEEFHRFGILEPRPRHPACLLASPCNKGDSKHRWVEFSNDVQDSGVYQRFQITVLLRLVA